MSEASKKTARIAKRGLKKVNKLQDKYEKETGGTDAVNENSSKKAKRIDAREQRVRKRYTKKIKNSMEQDKAKAEGAGKHTQKHKDQQDKKRKASQEKPMGGERKKKGKGKGLRGPRAEAPTPSVVARMEAEKQATNDSVKAAKSPGKMPDGYNMKRPAEKLGYIQSLGAGRVSPGKMGDMTAMKMMHGDAAAKYYDGAGMYMNGAPKYEGASKSMHSPMKHEIGHVEGIPTYETQNTTTTRSGGGGSSSTSSGSASQTKTVYTPPTRTAEGDAAYAALTPDQRKAQDDKYKKMNTKTVTTSGGGSSSTDKSKVNTKVDKKKKVIGTQTQKDILTKGKETTKNRASIRNAERDKAMLESQKDSIATANKGINKANKAFPLSQDLLDIGHRRGQRAGRETLLTAKGADGSRLFSSEEVKKLYNTSSGMERGTGVGENPNRKISKRNPEVRKFQQPGALGERPMMSDYEGGSKMGHNAPKMPKGPMKFGIKK
jgi:hypothetical protein